MEEVWVDIENYEGQYRISNFGNVWTTARKWTCGKSNTSNRETPEGIVKTWKSIYGYEMVDLRLNSKTKKISIHRLVAMHFLNNINNLPMVNHIDGKKSNNRVDNLEWCDGDYNMKHAVETGLIVSGEKNKHRLLSDAEANEVRKIYKYIKNQVKIANAYGVSQQTISRAVNKSDSYGK